MVAGIATAVAASWLLWLGGPDFPLDDAYIVQHSVYGLLAGGEDRFIGGHPLDGITSPAFIMPIAALSMVLPIAWAQALVCAGAMALYVVGLFRFAVAADVPTDWAALFTILGTTCGVTLWHLFNGLETGLAMAAMIWTLMWFRDPLPDRPWKCAILGVLPFLRPELAVFSVILCARAAWSAMKDRASMSRLAACAGSAIAGSLPMVVFLLLNDAPLIPNTTSAKVYFFAESCAPLSVQLKTAVYYAAGFFAKLDLAIIGLVGLFLSRWRNSAAAFMAVILTGIFLTLPSASAHNHDRYLYVFIPLVMAGWLALVSSPLNRVRVFSKLLMIAALAIVGARAGLVLEGYREEVDLRRDDMAELSEWIATHVSPDDVIAVHDAGYVSLHGSNPLVDIVGLKTPDATESHKRYTYETCSRDPRALDEIIRRYHARYFVVIDHWEGVFRLSRSLRSIGWGVDRVDTERGDTAYMLYRLTPPETRATN